VILGTEIGKTEGVAGKEARATKRELL